MAMTRRRLFGWTGLVIAVGLVFLLWIGFVLVVAQPELRFIADLTPSQSASVTAPTKDLLGQLGGLKARIEIAKYYERPRVRRPSRYDNAMLAIHEKVQSLTEDLLRQYGALGGDRVRVIDCNPRTFPERDQDWRERVGPRRGNHVLVVAVFIEDANGKESVRSDELHINSDLVAIDFARNPNVPGQSSRLPKVEKYLGEETITSTIKTLLEGGTPTVYLIDGHRGKVAGAKRGPYEVHEFCGTLQEQGFKVSVINLGDEEIPENATILASFEPEVEFSPAECQKLLAFLQRGGRVFLNLSYKTWSSWNVTLDPLLSELGVRVGKKMVAQFWNNAPAGKAATLEITRMNSNHAITASLFSNRRSVVLREAVEVERREPKPEGVNVDLTFLKTGDRCWIAPETGGNQGPNLRPPSGKEFYGSRAVGALVTVESGKSHPGKLVLVSGAIVRNVMIEEGSQRDFGLNCFEWLAERRLIVPIRKDTMKLATIDLGTNEDEKVTRLARAFWLQILWTPLFFLGLGILVGWRRRRI